MEGSNGKKWKEYGIDPLLPTDGQYHKPVTAPTQRTNLSNKEVQDKIEVYARASKKMERHFALQRIKDRHKQHIQKLNQNHLKQDLYYGSGERFRLLQSPHEVHKDDRHYANQEYNNEIIKEANREKSKDGLSKQFKHEKLGMRHSFNHFKNKGSDRER